MTKADCVTLFACALVAVGLSGAASAQIWIDGFPNPGSFAAGHSFDWAAGRHGKPATWLSYDRFGHKGTGGPLAGHSRYSGGGGIQCVTFARSDSGIELVGNANTWWGHAAGIYQRGATPEPGSVLSFRSNRAMPLGHVAVVNQVVDGRTLIIDHANWGGPGRGQGAITRSTSVVDVSPGNDWSAVRVALGHSGDYGSIYPTHGFIYNRPDGGTILASTATAAPIPSLNPAPSDLRPAREQPYDEVAEAPDGPAPAAFRGARRHGLALGNHEARRNRH